MKRTEIKRSKIRRLRSGEPIPASTPRRYRTKQGYIVLRWTVAPYQQVEVLEHRVVDGHVTPAEHVHHENRKRDDNSPENLTHTTAEAHFAEHREETRRRGQEMAELYAQGWSTIEIARRYRVNNSTVFRRLTDLGVEMRTKSDYSPHPEPAELAELYSSGRSVPSIARQYRLDSTRARALIVEGGAVIRRPGRPKKNPAQQENAARRAVRQRSDGLCEVCGVVKATNFQHRKNRGQGGAWTAENGLDVCGSGNYSGCHGRIHQNPTEARENGWSVSAYQDPATVPALLARHGLVYLTSDGQTIPTERTAA